MSYHEMLDQIKAQKANPLPTPPVSMTVQWFERNETERCYAAIVTFQEGPGRLKLCILKPNGHPMHKEGVLHRSDPVHANKHNTATMRNGAWDYRPGEGPLKSHRELHLKELERREAAIVKAMNDEQDMVAPQSAK
jgi:hypothetical protein